MLSNILTEQGVSNRYEPSETTIDNFSETLHAATEKCAAIRIGSPFGESITRHFSHEPALMMSLGSADCLVPAHGKWWTRSALYSAFHHMLREFGDHLNTTQTALIVGAGAAARIAIASLVKIGFKHIKITNQFHDQGIDMIAELKKTYFGVRFEFIPVNQLIMLPGTNSIMINTTPYIPENELVKELLYFNFLEPGGEVWDMTMTPVETALVREAEEIGTRVVRGFEIASWVDVVWAEWAFGHEINRNSYLKSLEKLLRENCPSSTNQSETGP